MVYYICFAFIIILNSLSANCESRAEPIMGGMPAHQQSFKYQVAIIGKHNKTNTYFLVCSGGIISDFFILTAAECIVDNIGRLMKLRFYVIIGSVNLKFNYKDPIDVVYIYTLTDESLYNAYNLAVLQIADNLSLKLYDHLDALDLPQKGQIFNPQANIAGYGYTHPNQRKNFGGRPAISENIDHKLIFAKVQLVSEADCKNMYSYTDPVKEFCGIINPIPGEEARGVCAYDEGAPLVIDNVVVGIAQKHRKDCDNTVVGNLYTNVSYFRDFINGVMWGKLIQDTFVYRNREQFMELPPGSEYSE